MPDLEDGAAPLVLELSGDIDVAYADEIVSRGEALMSGAAIGRRIVVDLGKVQFIDSSGLSGLLRLRRLAVARGLDIALRDIPPNVGVLLSLSGIDQVLPPE